MKREITFRSPTIATARDREHWIKQCRSSGCVIGKHRFHTATQLHRRPFSPTNENIISSNIKMIHSFHWECFCFCFRFEVLPENAVGEGVLFGDAKWWACGSGSGTCSEPRRHCGSSRCGSKDRLGGSGGGEWHSFASGILVLVCGCVFVSRVLHFFSGF